MYNLLIVDDEEIIRRGIEKKLSETGLFNVYSADNGRSAMEVIGEHKIHAMILDICMPEMNGLQMMERLAEKQDDTLVIVLSGYDDFEYAQKALKFKAFDYILKPVDSEDVKAMGDRIRQALDEKSESEKEYQLLKEEVEKSREMIKERFFLDLIGRKMDDTVFERKCAYLNLKINGGVFRVAVLNISIEQNTHGAKMEEMHQVLLKSIENFLSQVRDIAPGMEIFHLHEEDYILLFSGNSPLEDAKIHGFLEVLKSDFMHKYEVPVTIGLGSSGAGISRIAKSYEQALEALKRKLLLGTGYIYNIHDFIGNEVVAGLDDHLQGLHSDLITLRTEEILKKLKEAFCFIEENKSRLDPFAVQFFALKYVTVLISAMQGHGLSNESIQALESNPFKKVFEFNSIQEIKQWLQEFVKKVSLSIVEYNQKSYRNLVGQIKIFIEEKYFEDITVAYLSEVFNFSPNYLGQIFKNEVGATLSEYLNKVRVEEAKKLLKSTKLMIYEIAYKIGFSDQHYFSQVFKKLQGCTPKEYRDS